MKSIYVGVILIFLSCGYDFPTSYENIESYKVRPVAIIFDNKGVAEAAPRDTIQLRGYFSGEQLNEMRWYLLSTNGNNITYDTSDLTPFLLGGTPQAFTDGITDSVVLSFIVPESLIINTFKDVENFRTLVPSDMQSSFPSELLDSKPIEVIKILEQLSYGSTSNKTFIDSALLILAKDTAAGTNKILPLILQAFTVSCKIGATLNGKFNVESTLSVRYNNRLRYVGSYIPINKNPVISQVLLFKVKGSKKSFDPVADYQYIDTFYSFSGNQTIRFEKNYSYFLSAYTDYSTADTGITFSGTRNKEDYTFEWFFKNNDKIESSPDSLFYLDMWPPRSATVHLNPPLNSKMQHFSIWLVVYDFYIGERLRPVGFALQHADAQINWIQ